MTVLLYLEYDVSVPIDRLRNVTRFLKVDTLQIECALRDLPTFKGVFAYNQLPKHQHSAIRGTVILNTEIHTEPGSHYFAVYLDRRSLTG